MPALRAGKWVICDRFIDSTRVYQGALGKVDAQLIRGLERVTVGDAMPDLTFMLDVPATSGLRARSAGAAAARPTVSKSETIEFHENLRDGLPRARRATSRSACVVIDGRAAARGGGGAHLGRSSASG